MKRAKRNRHASKFLPGLITVFLCVAALMGSLGAAASENAGRRETTVINRGESLSPVDTALTIPQKESADRSAKIDSEDWMLTLVNAANPLSDDYVPKLKPLNNGLQFDERAIEQLNAMLSAAQEQGLSPVVCSAYRSVEKQRNLFENQVKQHIAKGLNREQAEIEARKSVAYPGTSEHNLGLAADIVSLDYQLLDDKQADTPEIKWLLAHCSEYGFILRYPKEKTDITGIIYEPWHFRYVGTGAANEIMESGICLEEYWDYIWDE